MHGANVAYFSAAQHKSNKFSLLLTVLFWKANDSAGVYDDLAYLKIIRLCTFYVAHNFIVAINQMEKLINKQFDK